jgi:hypothetical protein
MAEERKEEKVSGESENEGKSYQLTVKNRGRDWSNVITPRCS